MDTKNHKEVEGIILRSIPVKENDTLVTAFTRQGLITFSAHGVKKINSKNAPSVRLFTEGNYELSLSQKTGYFSLVTGTPKGSLEKIWNNISSMLALEMMAELTLRFVEESQTESLFSMFDALYHRLLDAKEEDIGNVLLIYLSRVIWINGIYPNTDGCVSCGSKKNIVSCSFTEGGYICCDCFRASRHENQSKDYLLLLRYLALPHTVEELSKKTFPPMIVRQLLIDAVAYLEDRFDLHLKSFELLEKIEKNK